MKHRGKNVLVKRLSAQVGSKKLAVNLLKQRGHLAADGKTLTTSGRQRDSMTARERAIDRASRYSGNRAKDYTYNPRTNRATLRKKN